MIITFKKEAEKGELLDCGCGDSGNDSAEIFYKCEEVTHEEITRHFENFIRACGFSFKGHFMIVEDEY